MITAYFDEMGTHAQSKVVLVNGLFMDSEDWEALEVDWKKVLSDFEVPYFHASECDARGGIYAGMSRTLRDLLTAGAAQVIANYKPIVLHAAITPEIWKTYERRNTAGYIQNPYHLCFEDCLQGAAHWAKSYGEPFALIFAEHQEYKMNAQAVYSLYRESPVWGEKLVSLTFAPADKFPALQAADLFGYELYRIAVAEQQNRELVMRPAIKVLLQANLQGVGFVFDGKALPQMIKAAGLI